MLDIINTIFTQIGKILTATLFQIGDSPISLSSIFELIFSLAIAIFISNTLSNFLKDRLLVKMGIDEGNREAIAVIVRYVIAILGIFIVLQSVGFNLGSLAVLAGGLGVGIGFGVQDLTTNFISGITLLVDRPVKVGDFIELGELMGTVKKISIRSTIIKTKNDLAVIVPNKTIIENQILNWSYENTICCLRIPVTVSEENDPLTVTEALLSAAYLESSVLYNPNPKVLFLELGEDGFKFELLVWIDHAILQQEVRSSLNFAIQYILQQQGISFPESNTLLSFQHPEMLAYLLTKGELPPQKSNDKTEDPTSDSSLQVVTKPKIQPIYLRELLRQIIYFQNLNDLELRQLIEAGYRQRLLASQILFRENDPGDAFYIILQGSVEVFVEKINKHLVNLSTGKFLGELALMLGIPRTATVRALEDTVLFAINKDGFQRLLKEQPDFYEQIVQELAKHQEELSARQKQLREMGLVDESEDDQNAVAWVRKRLKNLFSL